MVNYNLMPLLEHIALVKIATTLWNQDDIRALARVYIPLNGSVRREKWQEIEDKVVEKVPQLPQPGPLKEKILGSIKPIGLQILKWMVEVPYLGMDLPNNLCWTPQGTVDEKETAKALIKDERLSVTMRYKLACTYCLEEDILELWYKVPENRRKSLYKEEDPMDLVSLWTKKFLTEEVAKMNNMIKRGWKGNKVVVYFLQKLTPKEREEMLVEFAENISNQRCDSLLFFLLSQMNEEQQTDVFKSYSYKVLRCLLVWPLQSLFMESANCMWGFLSEEKYHLLLRRIVDKVIDGYKDCNYQRIFGEFWQQSPNSHKRYVIDECTRGFLLSKLFEIKDEKSIELILKDANLIEKKKLVFSDRGKDICLQFVYGDRLDLIEFFIRECISSRNEMMKLKEEFKERITCCCCSKEECASKKDKWDKFCQLLDNLIRGFYKRKSVEESYSSPAKKHCGIEFKEVAHSI